MFTSVRAEPLDAASLRQQRRLKQALQFLHRDSADLLPLDGLKKLGTAKQGQPHHILQKRLLEAKLSRGRTCALTPNNGVGPSRFHASEEEEEDFMCVPCKTVDPGGDTPSYPRSPERVRLVVELPASSRTFSLGLQCFGRDVNVLIDTGCRFNLMSSSTVDRLGLKEQVEENTAEVEALPFQRRLSVHGQIPELGLTVGQHRILCSFVVVESSRALISLGNKSLKSLQCVIDTEKQMLVFGTNVREQVHFVQKPLNKRSFNLGDL